MLPEKVTAPTGMAQYSPCARIGPSGSDTRSSCRRRWWVTRRSPCFYRDLIDAPSAGPAAAADVYEGAPSHGVLSLMEEPDGRLVQVRHRAGPCLTTASWRSPASSRSRGGGHAPSRFAVIGRYVLHPDTFLHLERIPRGAGARSS
jgi:hypothetical protein